MINKEEENKKKKKQKTKTEDLQKSTVYLRY